MELLGKLLSDETYLYRVEAFVVLTVLLFFVYVAYSLKLFKKD